ncbi:MAG: hypothetical protein C4529_09825 [Deltaproteobacteria bacterium]|nr:MAG: hypothetical protein C4529_09825 [Deltaproteobacteria bacterium]
MRLVIDGNEVRLDSSTPETLGAVVAEAGRLAAARGRVAHRIEVDGREISTREEREMSARPAAELGLVRVQTTTPAALLREALDGALDLSAAIRRDAKEVSSSLRSGDVPSAKSLYVSCIESLGTFFQLAGAVFNGVRSGAFPLPVAADGEKEELPGPPGSTAVILQRLLAAQKEEDWRRMADLLDREVTPNLEEWSAFFSAMRGRG